MWSAVKIANLSPLVHYFLDSIHVKHRNPKITGYVLFKPNIKYEKRNLIKIKKLDFVDGRKTSSQK